MTDTALENFFQAIGDRYRIERTLGVGGMATVYLAHDLKHDREVALKVLRPEVGATLGTARFLREIEIAAKLNHPHILALHDSGESEGTLYYVMPYVPDGTLLSFMREQGRMSINDTIRVLRSMADALEYAHGQGVIHRDIKPANVLLSGRHCLLADFGIAKALSEAAGGRNLTGFGAIGTPAYMAPEQAASDPDIDRRADIYALGVVGFEMLTGRPPFIDQDINTLLQAQIADQPPPISQFRKNVPRVLTNLIEKSLSKDPDERLPDMSAAIGELEKLGAWGRRSVEIGARDSWWALNRTRVTAAGGAVAVALVAGLAITTFRATDSNLEPRRVVVSSLVNQTGDTELDDVGSFSAHWITQGMQRTGTLDVVPSPTALQSFRQVMLDLDEGSVTDPVVALAEETGAGTVISGAYYATGDGLSFQIQITDARRRRLLTAVEVDAVDRAHVRDAVEQLRERVTGALAVAFDERLETPTGIGPPTFEAYRAFEEGLDAYTRSAYAEAMPHFMRSFEQDSSFAMPLLFASLSANNLGRWSTADSLVGVLAEFRDQLDEYHRYWLAYLEARVAGSNDGAVRAMRAASSVAPSSKASYNLAVMALRTGHVQEALDALHLLDPERGAMRNWLPYWNHLTWALHELGDYEEELAAARRARELHPERVRALQLEAEALAAVGRVEEIEAILVESQGVPRVTNRPPGWLAMSVARELQAHGFADEASRIFDWAIDWFVTNTPEDATPAERHRFGVTLYNAGRWAAADSLYQSLHTDVSSHAGARLYIGLLSARRGDIDGATRTLNWIAASNQPYQFGLSSWNRARIHALLGETPEAVELMRQALAEGRGVRRFRPHTDIDFETLSSDPAYQQLTQRRE